MDSANPQDDANGERDKPPNNVGFPPLIPPPAEHKPETTYCKPDQTPLWKIVLEVGAVAVGIVVAMIYYGQLEVMRGQLGEIIKQFPEIQRTASATVKAADQTERAVNNSKILFELDERGWVGIRSADLKGFIFTNFGKSPALYVTSEGGISFAYKREKIMPTWVKRFYTVNEEQILNFGPLFPGQTGALPPPIDITKNVFWADVQRGTKFLYFFGRIHYFTMDKWHDTTFCVMWVPNVGFDPGDDCSGYNSAN
jgi:hypothetical protein